MSDGISQAAWSSWSFPLWATTGLLVTALLYLRGLSKIRHTRPLIFPPWRAGALSAASSSSGWRLPHARHPGAAMLLVLPYDTAPDADLPSSAPLPLLLLGAPAVQVCDP